MTTDANSYDPPAFTGPAAPVDAPFRVLIQWLLLLVIVAAAVWAGWAVRVWQFNVTEPTHFVSDVTRNWLWGEYTWSNIHDRGRSYFDTYDELGIQDRRRQPYTDYAPLRMAVFTLWAATNEAAYPDRHFRTTRAFHEFYVDFNGSMEMIGAVGAFALVRAVVRRDRFTTRPAEPWWTFIGVWHGLAAALILWFNPAMWLSAHSWPGGDSWIIPPFIWAVFFAVRRCWFTAGAVLAIGALFKGQQFFIALVFILWPLFQARPLWAVRFICGLLAMFGLATFRWTLSYVDESFVRHTSVAATAYVLCLAACAGGLPLLLPAARRRIEHVRGGSAMVVAGAAVLCLLALAWPLLLIGRPFARPDASLILPDSNVRLLVLALLIVTTVSALFTRRRWTGVAALGAAGAGALLSMPLFGTCFAWFDAGYLFGANHWVYMVVGQTSNLPGILNGRYGWDMSTGASEVVTTLHVAKHAIDITLRQFLMTIFSVLLVIAAAGISVQDRRRSTRILIAICTPWLLFFCIPAQIHERYLLFGAAVAAVCIGHSVGMALLGTFLSAVTWIMTMHVLNGDPWRRMMWNHHLAKMYPTLFESDTRFAHSLQRFLDGTHPDIGWAVMLATLIFFYLSIAPLWARRRRVIGTEIITTEPTLPIVAAPLAAAHIVAPRDHLLLANDPIPLE